MRKTDMVKVASELRAIAQNYNSDIMSDVYDYDAVVEDSDYEVSISFRNERIIHSDMLEALLDIAHRYGCEYYVTNDNGGFNFVLWK